MMFAVLALAAGLCAPGFQEQVDIPPHSGPQSGILIEQDFAPGDTTGLHSHPGVELGYVLKGTVKVSIGGYSPAEYEVQAGRSFHIDRSRPHALSNAGSVPAAVLTTYVVDVGVAVTEPAK